MIWQWRAAASEAYLAIAVRPGRALLLGLGTILGTAMFVSTTGVAVTGANQIRATFDLSLATEVIATIPSEPSMTLVNPEGATRIHGVTSVGQWGTLNLPGLDISQDWIQPQGINSQVYVASSGALEVVNPHIISGTRYSEFAEARSARVVLLSRMLASQLDINGVVPEAYVRLSDVMYRVVGIFDQVGRQPQALLGAIIPYSTAETLYGKAMIGTPSVIVATDPGAAPQVANQLAVAIAPEAPDEVSVALPADPSGFFNQVNIDARNLYLLISVLALLLGGLSIGAASIFSVAQRAPEIGLRRSIGAHRMGVAAQFMFEGGILGLAGGIAGTCLGIIAVVAVSAVNGWTATLPWNTTLLAPVAGFSIGMVMSSYASLRASRISPLASLRR